MTPTPIGEALIFAHREKIEKTLQECIERMRQKSDGELHAFMREQNLALIKFLQYENRYLAVLAGEKVEPAQIEAEGVLIGTFGGGM